MYKSKKIYMHSILKCCIITFVYLFFFNSLKTYAQNSDKAFETKLNADLKFIDSLISDKDDDDYFKAKQLLDKLESDILNTKDTSKILEFYRKTIEIYAYHIDNENIKIYLDKEFNILQKYGDKRELGLYYESQGIYFSDQKQKLDTYLKAEKILSKYGKPIDNIDINFNLALIYLHNKDWDKTIYHSKNGLKNIELCNEKFDRRKYLYFCLLEALLEKKDLNSVKFYMNEFETKESKNFGNLYVTYKYNKILAKYYLQLNNLKKSNEYYEKSLIGCEELLKKKTVEISDYNRMKFKLEKKELLLSKVKKENEYKNYIFFFAILAFGLILFLAIFQYKNSKYKSRINDILNSNNKLLIDTNKELTNALDVKKNFLDTVTHELRTPLNTIKGVSFLLKNEHSEKIKNEYIETLNFSSDYLLRLINDIIDLSTLSKKKTKKLNLEDSNLKLLLYKTIDSLSISVKNNNEIILNCDENIPNLLKIDTVKISQIVINLVANSLKFTRNGKINVVAKLDKINTEIATIYFEISDNGIGINKEVHNKIFDAFFQESVAINRKYGGTGLGLSIVNNIIELHNSKIHLESEVGKGAKFYFIINFEISTPIKQLGDSIKITDLQKTFINNNITKILLVEDNKINQFITKKIITNKGYVCDVAANGQEAVDLALTGNYSLILMDIMMPVMDGFEATKIIKDAKPDVPVIALTAISEDINKENFDNNQFVKVLTKPVDAEILYKFIDEYANKHKL